MNWASVRRKTVLLAVLTAGAVGLAGCASYYPYTSHDGVYYGKSYDRYGHHSPYGYSSYGYRVFDYGYDRGYWYRPYRYGYYGHYRRDDHDRHHETGDHGEDRASDELRRITRDPRARHDPPSSHRPRLRREKRDTTAEQRDTPGGSGARDELRHTRSRPTETPRPAPRTGIRTTPDDRQREGGIATPRDRRR